MLVIKTENGLKIATGTEERENPFDVKRGTNGRNYVTLSSVGSDRLNVAEGNSKTGSNVINFNFPIEMTCNHACECYKNATCYACNGCYLFANNQALYSENLNFFNNNPYHVFIDALQLVIDKTGYKLFRYFTCGDIPNSRFLDCMVTLAERNPDVKFWTYTKKYHIVNSYISENGGFPSCAAIPENLKIIFSHWLNEDGTYFPMDNPYNLPTSEFIPYGREELKEKVTHICPCSDPSVNATCATCDHPCYTLKNGESMALLEHSTKQTKERDKAIKTAKQAIKKGV